MTLPDGSHKEGFKDIDFNETILKKSVAISPLKSGGSNFKTNVLSIESNSKLVYKPSMGIALFCFIFLAIGLGVLFFSLFQDFLETEMPNFFLIIFGLVFASAGGFMFYSSYKPRVFDKQKSIYYKSYSKGNKNNKSVIPLNTIAAIQLLGEHITSDKGSYKSFELNLVFKDGSRKNVVDHGNLKSIIDDAHIISEFLNIPIWHAKSSEN